MTILVKNPLPRLTRRRFLMIVLVIVIVLAAGVPVTSYWALQRNDMHIRWDLQATYAEEFWSHADDAAGLLSGIVAHWSNVTEIFVSNELAYADWQLNSISHLDTSHANQLFRISYAIESLRTQDYIHNMNSSQRMNLATQLYSIRMKVRNAFTNYLNYTSSGTAAGPPFWYSGPSPPDERLLQDAVNIALGFQRP